MVNFSLYVLDLNPKTSFEALETNFRHYNRVLRRILTGHNSSKLGHGLREARPTAGMGLAKSTTSVGPDPLLSLSWPWVSGGCVCLSLVWIFLILI
jgi:hypothetical protein